MSGIEDSNEKVIKNLYNIILVIIILCGIACMIIGIVYWANSTQTASSYYSTRLTTYTDDAMVVMGFVYFFGGAIASAFMAMINYVLFGMIFDIKAIRNSLMKSDAAKRQTITSDNRWKCPNCGTVNGNYVVVCSCGTWKR